jgi:ADP-heptose:LPS heptosyltransferase
MTEEVFPVKFLIVRFSSIGDIVLTTPVIRCIKKQIEGAEIFFLTKKQFAPVLINNPYIDKIFLLDDSLANVINELKKEEIHYIIDLHNNLRSHTVIRRLKLLAFSFNKLNFKKWILVNFKLDLLPEKHIVDRYLETLKLFDVKDDGKGLDYFISATDELTVNQLPDIHRNGYVAFAIGALHYTKQLTTDKIINICHYLKYPVVLLGSENDFDKGKAIEEHTGDFVYNACGKFNINQSAAIIKSAKVIITSDTGLMHIAAAFKKPIISVWGNTVPKFGMYPYLPGEKSEIIEVKNLRCRPCSKLGYKKCPKKHFRCINDIDENIVAEKVKKIIYEL